MEKVQTNKNKNACHYNDFILSSSSIKANVGFTEKPRVKVKRATSPPGVPPELAVNHFVSLSVYPPL